MNLTMSRNNLSRKLFKDFCIKLGVKPVGKTNSFINNRGYRIGFALKTDNNTVRQYGEDYKGVVVSNDTLSEIKYYDSGNVVKGSLSRIGTDGYKYYNVSLKEVVNA